MIAEITETKRMVRVTEEDIANGIRCNVHLCPIAQGIMRSVPNIEGVEILGSIQIWFEDGSLVARHLTEEEMRFISDFDNGRCVEPIEVEIPGDLDMTVERWAWWEPESEEERKTWLRE